MSRVLLTAFEPYDRWSENASWLTVVELTKQLPSAPQVTPRLYPVDYGRTLELVTEDLRADYDVAIHVGQAPGRGRLSLEAVALNLRTFADGSFGPLLADGPEAYFSPLPLLDWTRQLNAAGLPAEVSFHAGTYLCNAVFYYTSHLSRVLGLRTESFFLHVPLDVRQQANESTNTPCLPVEYGAAALRLILNEVADYT